MKKRILSLLLILCMAVTLLPTAAFAEEATGTPGTPTEDSKEQQSTEPRTSSAGGTIYVDATTGDDTQEDVGTTAAKAYKTLEKRLPPLRAEIPSSWARATIRCTKSTAWGIPKAKT